MDSRYEALRAFLESSTADSVRMTFKDIEGLLHASLPPSARTHRAWWGNHASHTHARNGWMAAGWRTAHVDMGSGELTFERATTAPNGGISRGRGVALGGWDEVEGQVGGAENLRQILRGVERYVRGEIVETELGRIVRQFWGRAGS